MISLILILILSSEKQDQLSTRSVGEASSVGANVAMQARISAKVCLKLSALTKPLC